MTLCFVVNLLLNIALSLQLELYRLTQDTARLRQIDLIGDGIGYNSIVLYENTAKL